MAREERVCKECGSGEVEDVEHWVLRCEAWKTFREPLLARVQEHQEGEPSWGRHYRSAVVGAP